MDFISKLTGDAQTGHTSNPHTIADEGRLVDRIGSKYDHKGAAGEHNETLVDKIGSVFHHSNTGDNYSSTPAVGTASPGHVRDEAGNLINTITSAFSTYGIGAQPPTAEGANHSSPHAQSGLVDKIAAFTHSGRPEQPKEEGIMDKINGVFGGGTKGEAKEDHLDKVIDAFQEHVLKEGPQHSESALEQAKDGQIAGAIRSGFKSLTGHEFPIHEKE